MQSLNDLRVKIDSIDAELIKLFEERMNISREIAEFKEKNGLSIYDQDREKKVIENNISHVSDELKVYVEEFVQCIMRISKKIQSKSTNVK
ncbi:chorismate mutase [Alkalibaculum sp. M08DMB]|uniref:Chorismate mutase n=1 Tax=Alkalibaculum sporogenes TaxID=2655001 RepID=A0A6A7KB12_9FIRM|nr:chorismate mutase [Alkalibaculum sporogenes]MPW26213.1 chorismate mutase [Alkalibaculum sporogenes]